MKKIMSAILLIACTSLTGAYVEKYYVEPGTVHVARDGIFLFIDGQVYPVHALAADENGVYIPTPEGRICSKHGRYYGTGPCPKCLIEEKNKNK